VVELLITAEAFCTVLNMGIRAVGTSASKGVTCGIQALQNAVHFGGVSGLNTHKLAIRISTIRLNADCSMRPAAQLDCCEPCYSRADASDCVLRYQNSYKERHRGPWSTPDI
jgi:hypothetical protein